MISEPTVLILGAGASSPYGYPTGPELLTRVLQELSNESPLRTFLGRVGILDHVIAEFPMALRRSGRGSIDVFLEYRDEFVLIGKLAMAFVLTTCEHESGLFDLWNTGEAWYAYLWDKMSVGKLGELGENNLTVVTFNYDRSLEHYLHTVAGYAFGESPEECTAAVSQIPIIHVHGRLGWLPWQSEAPARKYCPPAEDSWQDVLYCADLIKIVSEGTVVSQDDEFSRAHKAISKAAKVCFLGFGYNRKNIERLELSRTPDDALVTGTGHGYTSNEKQGLEKMLWQALDTRPGSVQLGGGGVKVLEHLRHTGILD